MYFRTRQTEARSKRTRLTAAQLWLVPVLLVLGGAGCNFYYDLDSVAFPAPTADAGDVDIDVGSADSGDSGDVAQDAAQPACRASVGEGCNDGQNCVVDQLSGRARCVDEASFGSRPEGQACAASTDCAPGLLCIDWALPDPRGTVCSKPCSTSTGEGCGLGEFCARTAADALPIDLGLCTSQCDIFNPTDACAAGQACVPDPTHDGGGYPPFARCMVDGGAADKSTGAGCKAAELDADGCPQGLSCLPVKFQGTIGEFCLKPCRGFDDCQDTSVSYSMCASIEGSTNVGYCSP